MEEGDDLINLRNKKIIVTFLMHLGDLILISPFLQVLRRHTQGSEITLVVDEKLKDVMLYNPNIDHLVTVDKKGRTIPLERYGALAESSMKIITMCSSIFIRMNGRVF